MGQRLGQHFLVRKTILESIARAACPAPGGTVIEIGPGKGALTTHLLAHAARVIAIEIDPVLVLYLTAKFREEPRLTLIESDVLKADLSGWGTVTVVGNLPYYITSPIVERVLTLGPLLELAVFLVQKEVAERMTASAGSRDYGYLSVQTQFYSTPELLLGVPPSAFHPPPKVDSAVVRMTPKAAPDSVDARGFLKFAGLCFRQKRKTLRNNLLGSYDKALLEEIPEARLRAEQLGMEGMMDLYERLRALRAD